MSKIIIERVLYGCDVNLTATHMAAATLGLLSPQTQFRNMKIARVLLGMEDRKAYLGSLEFLVQNQMMLPWPNQEYTGEQIDSGEEVHVQKKSMDIVIMNPPFTRNSLRHDQFTRKEEEMLRKREKTLLGNSPVHLSSNGNSFLFLANYLNKDTDGATLAAVLPLVTATNPSSLPMRKYLAEHYHIEKIITSYDPQRSCFSENTTISEMLLICRRWSRKARPPTKIIKLTENPDNPSKAFTVANKIKKDAKGNTSTLGVIQDWPEERIVQGNWRGVQFLSPYLCEKFVEIQEDKYFKTVLLSDIADIGPDGRKIRETYERTTMPTKENWKALWDHKTTDIPQTMSGQPDTYILAKEGKVKDAHRFWEQRGNLLLPTRMRLTVVCRFAVRMETKVVGSAWVPCKPYENRREVEKSICVYLNSTLGILTLLGNRSNKSMSYPQIALDTLRKLQFPEFTTDAITQLARHYDLLKKEKIRSLPQIKTCPVRKSLDETVVQVLNLGKEWINTLEDIKALLAEDPSVTGKRYRG